MIVGGAPSKRRFSEFVKLAALLAAEFTVVNHDRRGRGDSGDAPTYAIEREIEDLTYDWTLLGDDHQGRPLRRSDRSRELARQSHNPSNKALATAVVDALAPGRDATVSRPAAAPVV